MWPRVAAIRQPVITAAACFRRARARPFPAGRGPGEIEPPARSRTGLPYGRRPRCRRARRPAKACPGRQSTLISTMRKTLPLSSPFFQKAAAARTAPEMGLPRRDATAEGLGVHPGEHQHLAALGIRGDGADEAPGLSNLGWNSNPLSTSAVAPRRGNLIESVCVMEEYRALERRQGAAWAFGPGIHS